MESRTEEEHGTRSRNKRPVVVVDDGEWRDTVREIVRRDYFPLAPCREEDPLRAELVGSKGDEAANAKRARLDDYLAGHLSKEHAAFSEVLNRNAEEHLAMFSNKKDFLRKLEVDPETKLVKDDHKNAETIPKDRSIQPSGTRFPPPPSSSGAKRRSILRPEDRPRQKDFDLVSLASRTTATSLRSWHSGVPGQKPLSERGLALVAKLRKNQQRRAPNEG